MGSWSDEKLFSSKKDDWGTPAALYGALHHRFGPFSVDLAASSGNAKCAAWYGLDHPDPSFRNALSCGWAQGGLAPAFLNPPYGRQMVPWLKKASEESVQQCRRIVVLTFARTDTEWWHDWVLATAAEVCFIRGRITFTDSNGQPRRDKHGRVQAAPAPSCAIIYDGYASAASPRLTSMERPSEDWT
jgi:site-specific DNA-methyltransferase (adenine-specific)